jgi:hypothetical protein
MSIPSHLRAPTHTGPTGRRGIALMLVLSVVAAASILSWAMLSASTLRSQVDTNAADSLEASYLAESGVSYAMYYLRYPEKSPVGLVAGAFDTHYPGQSNLSLWADARGTVNITVTNTAAYTFRIRSSSSVNGTERTVSADVRLTTLGYPVTSAAGFNGPFTVGALTQINGPVLATGAVGGSTANITGSPALVAAGSAVVPTAAQVQLLSETGVAAVGTGVSTDRTYTYRGKTYVAERAPSVILVTLFSLRPQLNPMNVWYSDSNVSLSGAAFEGTLVLRNSAKLTVSATSVVSAKPGMPALIVGGDMDMRNTLTLPSKLTVNGVTWIGNRITSTGTLRTDGELKIEGALLMGGSAPSVTHGNSPVRVAYNTHALKVKDLSNVRTVNGIEVINWNAAD